MAVDVIMPQMGESIFEGTITKWLKKPGDRVERDEPLFEISTDKVDAEIPAPSAGVLKEIKVTEGQTVPIQTVVAVIDAERRRRGTRRSRSAPAAKAEAPKPAKAAEPKPPSPRQSRSSGRTARHKPRAPAPPTRRRRTHAPAAQMDRKFAVPRWSAAWRKSTTSILTQVHGTGAAAASASGHSRRHRGWHGPRRRTCIRCSSVIGVPRRPPRGPPRLRRRRLRARRRRTPAFESAVPRERMYFGNYEAQPMTVMRQRIAEHMVLSKRVSPHVYSIDEADMTRIAALRAKIESEIRSRVRHQAHLHAVLRARRVEGLRAFPTVNASADGTNMVLHREINIGIAVALDWGLIVPVIKNAEEKNFLGLARGMNDLAERARTKKLKPEEVQEGTFSITNPGVFGGLMGLPVINQPNVAILGIGAIQKRPVVIDDAIAIRSMVYLTLSYDHRVVDGAIAHQFMGKIKHTLENWTESIL